MLNDAAVPLPRPCRFSHLLLLFRVIRGVFPCFIRAPSDSNAKPIEQLYAGDCYHTQLAITETHQHSAREEGEKHTELSSMNLAVVCCMTLRGRSDYR